MSLPEPTLWFPLPGVMQLYAKSVTLPEPHPDTSPKNQSEYLSEYLKESGIKSLSFITVDIFLQEASTEGIIEHLKVPIPQWKKQLKMKKTAAWKYRFGKSTLRKIIEYHIYPGDRPDFFGVLIMATSKFHSR